MDTKAFESGKNGGGFRTVLDTVFTIKVIKYKNCSI